MRSADDDVVWRGEMLNTSDTRDAGAGQRGLQSVKDSSILSSKHFLFALAPLRIAR